MCWLPAITSTSSRCLLLLEILIAISLLAAGLVGITQSPRLLHAKALSRLETVEADRIAVWTYTEIRDKLRWDDIPEVRKKGEEVPLSDAVFALPSLKSKSLHRSYHLATLQEKQEPNGHTYRLVSARILVGKRTFTYRLTVEKK